MDSLSKVQEWNWHHEYYVADKYYTKSKRWNITVVESDKIYLIFDQLVPD